MTGILIVAAIGVVVALFCRPLFALSANAEIPRLVDQDLRLYKVAASTHIYKGAVAGIDASGYLTTMAAGVLFAGIAYEEADNSSGSAGDKSARVYTQGDFELTVSAAVIGDIGRPVYASDDGTFTLSPANAGYIGSAVSFETAGKLYVRIEPGFTVYSGMVIGKCEVDCQTGETPQDVTVIPAQINEAGIVIVGAWAIVTEVFGGDTEDQGIVALQDTDGTAINLTFTATDAGADAVNDVIQEAGSNDTLIGAASGDAGAVVAAGKGVKAKVTQATSGASAAGKMKIVVAAVPL
jgi:hypothetical protein